MSMLRTTSIPTILASELSPATIRAAQVQRERMLAKLQPEAAEAVERAEREADRRTIGAAFGVPARMVGER